MYFHPLNFIRFVLAVGVILFHYGQYYYPFNEPVLKTLIVNSSFRVSFFFFISGFVMSMVYGKQSEPLYTKLFLKRRLTRIYPLYLFAFIWTISSVLFINHASPKGLNIIVHALGLQSLYPGHILDLNFTTWSISVELVFYLFFPFLLKWMMQMSIQKLIVYSLIIWSLQSLQHVLFVNNLYNGSKTMEEFISAFPLWHFSTFFAGMVTARLIALDAFGSLVKKRTLFLMFIVLSIFAFIIYFPNPILKYVHNGLLSPLFMLLIVSLYYDRSVIHSFLSNKHVSALGDLSYGLFIFQYPLWLSCSYFVKSETEKSSWFFLLYFSSLIIVAALVNKFIEKPMLNWLRKEKIK